MLDKDERWHTDKADTNTQKRFGLKKGQQNSTRKQADSYRETVTPYF